MPDPHQALDTPSPWITRFAPLIPAGGQVLDVACGGGRHARWLAARGYAVDAVDRDPAVMALSAVAGVAPLVADLEGGPWPYAGRRFEGIVVANYLHRPLLPLLVGSVAPGGVLIYETFGLGNERYGRPGNPDYLLRPGELVEAVHDQLQVVAYEHVHVTDPRPAVVQRICARRAKGGA